MMSVTNVYATAGEWETEGKGDTTLQKGTRNTRPENQVIEERLNNLIKKLEPLLEKT